MNSHKVHSHFDKVGVRYLSSPMARFIKKIEVQAVLDNLPLSLQGTSLLDIGCGSGYLMPILLKRNPAKITGIDLSGVMLNRVPKDSRIQLYQDHFMNLKADQLYDFVFLCGVLEFVEEPFLFLKQVMNWSKKDGHIIILYPPLNFTGWLYKQYHYYLHQFHIHLFETNIITHWMHLLGWNLQTRTRPHSYALVEVYVNA